MEAEAELGTTFANDDVEAEIAVEMEAAPANSDVVAEAETEVERACQELPRAISSQQNLIFRLFLSPHHYKSVPAWV